MTEIIVTHPILIEKDWTDFRMFAIRCHGDQRYGNYPYSYHLAMVENALDEHGFSNNVFRAAAWLHDCLEDTKTTIEEIGYFYGPEIAALVWACTGVGETRKLRNKEIYYRLSIYPNAAPIKVADRLANITFASSTKMGGYNVEKIKMYLEEWDAFKENVKPLLEDDSRKLVLWNTLCTAMENAKAKLKAKK